MTPHVLLLQEDQATGGVNTMAATLTEALRQAGWRVSVLTLVNASWRQRLQAFRQCDLILASNNFRPAYVGWAWSLWTRKPVVVWTHGPLQEVLALAGAKLFKRAWLRWLYRRLPHWVFVSAASRDSFVAFMGSALYPGQQLDVIANAVTMQAPPADAIRAPASDALDLQLAYVGRLSEEKQPQLLLDVLRLLPANVHLTLVGDGPMRATLAQAGADLLASGRLTLAGAQAHGPDLYRRWDLTLLASRYEGCPMTLLESLAMGVPCVGLPIAALNEILGQDAPYMLARAHTAQALADAVIAVLAKPRAPMLADMRRVLARHQPDRFARDWQHVLQQAMPPC